MANSLVCCHFQVVSTLEACIKIHERRKEDRREHYHEAYVCKREIIQPFCASVPAWLGKRVDAVWNWPALFLRLPRGTSKGSLFPFLLFVGTGSEEVCWFSELCDKLP